jgi:hypothetical protein
MALNLNPENKRIKNGSARLKIPLPCPRAGFFFAIKIMK